jgi:filamentous hemagglutinin
MNKYCYRHVFNKARGIMMVVSDIVRSRSKASGGGTVARNVKVKSASFTPISFAIRLALGAVILPVSAQAEIIADRAAPSDQRPTILVTPNDIPLVNIRTPNSAGVSHNTYQQFDVQQQGVILNNSRTNVQTLQGGWVEGNPWLATGGARVILNEVNSSDPSMLNGYVEVAGQQAQVVIANPAGVTCTDCGFINANRVTLTSGRPVIRNGNLESYRVEGGAVTIAGENGMDSSTADYTDLIAQSVQLNAKVWANELKVTTGNNEVNADNTEAIEIAVPAAATQPAYAIDVAQLGGMYAGKIVLVGTQAGVGVRNAGDIGASAGEVVISADGRIENSGTLRNSAGDIQIATNTGVDNRGTLLANGSIRVTAQGETSQVNSTTEAIIAAGVQDDGSIGDSGNISLSAGDNVTLSGKSFSGGTHSVTAATVDLSGSQTSAQQVVLTAHEGDVDLSNAVLVSEQNLQIATPTALITHQADLSSEW